MNFDGAFFLRTFLTALTGVPTTLLITVVAFAIGLPLGFLLALSRIYKVKGLSQVATIFISFFRGTPLVVQIFLAYTVLPRLILSATAAWGMDIDIYSVNPVFYAFVVFAFNSAAGYSEMWKASLHAVGVEQLEAAHAIGLTSAEGYRHILIPQALVVAAPSICTSSLNMLKGTSLVFIMSIQEVTAKAKIAAGMEYKYIEGYLGVFIIYLIVCITLERGFKLWEKRLRSYKTAVAA